MPSENTPYKLPSYEGSIPDKDYSNRITKPDQVSTFVVRPGRPRLPVRPEASPISPLSLTSLDVKTEAEEDEPSSLVQVEPRPIPTLGSPSADGIVKSEEPSGGMPSVWAYMQTEPELKTEVHEPLRWEHFNDIQVFAPAKSEDAQIGFIKQYRVSHLAKWKVERKRFPDNVDLDIPELLPYLIRLKSFVSFLGTFDITPRIHKEGGLESLLAIMKKPEYKYPDFIVERFEKMYEGWKAIDFGAVNEGETGSDGDSDDPEHEPSVSKARTATTNGLPVRRRTQADEEVGEEVIARQPPANHPVYGVHGIMHGIIRQQNGKGAYRLNGRFEKRPSNVRGHNGLTPGQWWPMQIAALFNGAHGSACGGISGGMNHGAYSIVVADYDDLDRDLGNEIWYSGSNSHKNTNALALPEDSNATKALLYSYQHGHVVRVLRKANRKSRWAPKCGIRYDGLYGLAGHNDKARNNHGGLYRQFRLVREPNQPPLSEVIANPRPPTREQEDLYKRAKAGY